MHWVLSGTHEGRDEVLTGSRQILSRARAHVDSARPTGPNDPPWPQGHGAMKTARRRRGPTDPEERLDRRATERVNTRCSCTRCRGVLGPYPTTRRRDRVPVMRQRGRGKTRSGKRHPVVHGVRVGVVAGDVGAPRARTLGGNPGLSISGGGGGGTTYYHGKRRKAPLRHRECTARTPTHRSCLRNTKTESVDRTDYRNEKDDTTTPVPQSLSYTLGDTGESPTPRTLDAPLVGRGEFPFPGSGRPKHV